MRISIIERFDSNYQFVVITFSGRFLNRRIFLLHVQKELGESEYSINN